MGWISEIREALEIAQILRKHLPEIREAFEDLADLHVRQGRQAEVGDLNESLVKLRILDRRRG
jgi:hypothetical protein